MTSSSGTGRAVASVLGTAVVGVILSWLISVLAAEGYLDKTAAAWTHMVVALLVLGILALRYDQSDRPVVRILTALIFVLTGWYSLVAMTHCWFDTWQQQPNPPPEAFSDGAALTGVVMAGWLPPLTAFLACRFFVVLRRRFVAARAKY